MATVKHLAVLVSSLALVSLGCNDETLSPLSGGSSSGDASSGSGSSSSGMETPIREVFTRNPWGMPANNLLVDGDFEFSITPYEGQYGWLLISEASGATLPLNTETGGICRSGLKCGVATKGAILFGRGTSAPELAPMRGTLFAKPSEPPAEGADAVKHCKDAIEAYAIDCDSFDIIKKFQSVGAPAADGWCEYGVDVPGRRGAVCIYASIAKASLMDACTLLPSPEPSPSPVPFSLTTGTESMKRIGAMIKSRMRFGRPPEPPLPEADR